jgi:hypothetical protein
MIVTFRTDVPLLETMFFEGEYVGDDEPLQLDEDAKADIILRPDAIAVWLFVDGVIAGETYGVPDYRKQHVFYCWSTTILSRFQKRGLSRILCAYWLALVKATGRYRVVTGHATNEPMCKVKGFFGATFTAPPIDNWGGSKRTAHPYELAL